jgi:hypothetical protein
VTQDSSVRAGLANLATRGLNDVIPWDSETGVDLWAMFKVSSTVFPLLKKYFQNPWRDWAVENALDR